MIRLFRVFIPTSTLALIFCDAVLLYACYVLGTYLGLREYAESYLVDDGGFWRITVVVGIILIGLYMQDMYEQHPHHKFVYVFQQLCVTLGAAFLLQAVIGYGSSKLLLHKWSMIDGSLLILVILPAWRVAFGTLIRKAMPGEKILLAGSSPVLRRIAEHVKLHPELGLTIIGYADDAVLDESFPVPRLGGIEDLEKTVERVRPDRIVVGKGDNEELPLQKLLELRFAGMHIEEAALMYEAVFGRVSTTDLQLAQLVFSPELGPPQRRLKLQSIYSFILGGVGLVISLPILAIVAILVKISSPGPVLYRQTRVGLRGVPFEVFKFRSMYANAEAGTGAVWAMKSDPRVTPIGKWLRQLRLDELPQFFNVVRGEMAVAGPRPERPEFCEILEKTIPFYKQRHCVKPGITGWAQINHAYTDTIEDSLTKLEYDLYYIKNLTPSLDFYIIFHTLKVMLLSRGSR